MTPISRAWLAPVALGLLLVPLPARAADLSKYLPDKAGIIGHIDIRQILESPLAKKGIQEHLAQLKKGEHAKEIFEALGFDPEKDLKGITFGAPLSIDGAEKAVAVISGNFDVDKFQKVAKTHAEEHSDRLKITKSGNFTVWEVSGIESPPNVQLPETVYIVLVDKNTLLIVGGKDVLKDALAKAGGGKTTELSKTLSTGLEAVDPKQSGWILIEAAAVGKADFPNAERLGPALEQLRTLSGGATLTNDVVIRFDLTAKDAQVAKQLSVGIKRGLAAAPALIQFAAQQNEQVAPFVDSISDLLKTAKSTVKESTVTIKLTLDKELLEKMGKAAKKAKDGDK